MPAVVAGNLYYVADETIRLLPEERRQQHKERRLFLVLSGSEINSNDDWPVVVGCPVSGSTSFRTRFDVMLAYGEAGVIKKCWIRVPAIQPLLKQDLEDTTGALSPERLGEVQARVLEYLGLVTRAAPQPGGT